MNGGYENISLSTFMQETWVNETDVECAALPGNQNSFGIWATSTQDQKQFWDYSVPYMELTFVLVFGTWQFLHFFLKRLGFIKFTSHIITGILLGSVFLPDSSRRLFFPYDYKEIVIGTSGSFGYLIFWFLMGVKMDVGMISKTGKQAVVIAGSSVLIPILICSGIFVMNLLTIGGDRAEPDLEDFERVVVYAVASLTSYPVVGSLLYELKIQNSELGRLAISSSVVSDLLSSFLAAILIFLKELRNMDIAESWDPTAAIFHLMAMVVFVFLAIYAFRPAMIWVVKRTPEGQRVKESYIYSIVTLAFGAAVYVNKCKQFFLLGPFILGLTVPDGPPLGSALVEKLEPAVMGTLLPYFVATCANEFNYNDIFNLVGDSKNLLVVAVLVLTSVIKFVATASSALLYHYPVRDSLALALIMCFKGIVDLGSFALAFQRKSIRPETFSIVIVYITLSSIMVPLILKRVYGPSRIYAGYKKRNMLHMKPNSELRILVCIHRPVDISPMINLLEASCPTKENPIAVYALHLIETVGKLHPDFISHKIRTQKVGNQSYSDNVIISFNQFQAESWGSVNVHTFTAVSTPKAMHGDICMLALNNTTSLIVLPFHRTWSVDGSTIVSDSVMIQILNQSVLDMAPCSVGILVDRSRLGRKTVKDAASADSSYKVCMIFLGGKDDREALTLARRMARDSRLSLTVVRLVPSTDEPENSDWATMLDVAVLKDVTRNKTGEEYVVYMEERVQDASETPLVLRSIAHDYDMFVVGRENGRKSTLTKGLEEWSEFKELGVIGDLLASTDLNIRASVLVVQQQQQMI